jgi:hypothetical protein
MREIKDTLKLVTKIYKVTKDKKYISVIWVDKKTRDFFFKTQEIKKFRYKCRVSN